MQCVKFIRYSAINFNLLKLVLSFQLAGHSSPNAGKGKSYQGNVRVTYGFSLVKGKANHPMEDFHVAKFIQVKGHELGLFAIFDGHLGDSVPAYLQKHLFANILKEVGFFSIFPFSVLFGLPDVGS